ncbi:DNA-binding transcriptional MerR regulator [Actinoplanes octamycinicus]|uniref:DNA-binding transcriptional MerR regulator n=1 Tax=Actinoplanes octamycinicus TaxID=135948 RepID=A0A7W7M5Y5_9ACTN|nr:MerR family transcriptional regulator [Actinoplanes octamycinicus]MBB4738272.1 DNA-binding transcriptional MerR regulator [Actinoplanes octamycinicus]GIE59167.1 transcriptional regulator [Actinoplanes octamycinicus]
MADEALSAGAAARRLGVAVTTLRTWHQRYGLGPSRHEPGHHRRYTAEDMGRLQVMQRLTAQGVAPAEAAAWARNAPQGDPALHPAPVRLDAAARGLARAALRLDAPAMRDILCAAITQRGVVAAWADVVSPVLVGIGDRYQTTQRYIEVEHLLARTVTEVLATTPRPAGVPRILLAAADEEQHTLALEALAAALGEAGVPCRLFGARLPSAALLDAIGRTGPAAVVLWSQTPRTGTVEQLTRVRDAPCPPIVVAAAGPGWPEDDLPIGVTRLTGLGEALHLLASI